jgi:hypothetical protein
MMPMPAERGEGGGTIRRGPPDQLLEGGEGLRRFRPRAFKGRKHGNDLDEQHFNVTVAAPPPPLTHVDVRPPTNDLFTMSQRSGSLTYTLFGAGFSLAVLALFILACDIGSFRLGVFRTFGSNALAAYIIHDLVNAAVKPFVPRDAPLWFVFAGCAVSLTLSYVFVRNLEKNKIFLKL